MPSSEFQWLAVVFGMLTGLGVTRLLSGVAATLRSRSVSQLDWICLTWSASLFLILLEYWWFAHDLKALVSEWRYSEFLRLLGSPLLLFMSAALILPAHELKPGETHREIFENHGHWALIGISAYYIKIVSDTVIVWHFSVFNLWGVFMFSIIAMPIIAFFSHRRLNGFLAVLFLALHVAGIFVNFGALRSS